MNDQQEFVLELVDRIQEEARGSDDRPKQLIGDAEAHWFRQEARFDEVIDKLENLEAQQDRLQDMFVALVENLDRAQDSTAEEDNVEDQVRESEEPAQESDDETEAAEINEEEKFEEAMDGFERKLEKYDDDCYEADDVDDEPEADDPQDSEASYPCPQCDEEFDTVQALIGHTAPSKDHINIRKFFQGDDDDFHCNRCGKSSKSVDGLKQHFLTNHEDSMAEAYVQDFDQLRKNRVDGPYDYDGNIPELHQSKRVMDYEKHQIKSKVESHLEEVGYKQSISQLGRSVFDEELEASTSSYNKLYLAVMELYESGLVERDRNPANRNEYKYYVP